MTCSDPSFLFDLPDFTETGALFWPDFWRLKQYGPMWDIIGKRYEDVITGKEAGTVQEQESGQLLVDKSRHWPALALAVHFNLKHRYYYSILNGDKEDRPPPCTHMTMPSASKSSTPRPMAGHLSVQFPRLGPPVHDDIYPDSFCGQHRLRGVRGAYNGPGRPHRPAAVLSPESR